MHAHMHTHTPMQGLAQRVGPAGRQEVHSKARRRGNRKRRGHPGQVSLTEALDKAVHCSKRHKEPRGLIAGVVVRALARRWGSQ